MRVRLLEADDVRIRFEAACTRLGDDAFLAEALGIALVTLDEPWAVRDLDLVVATDAEQSIATRLLISVLRRVDEAIL